MVFKLLQPLRSLDEGNCSYKRERLPTGDCGLIGILKASVGPSLLLWAYSPLCSLLPMAGLCTLMPPGEAAASGEGWPQGMALAFAAAFPPPPLGRPLDSYPDLCPLLTM